MAETISKAEARRRALAAWWERGPWPAVILTIDPGESAGATIGHSKPGGLVMEWSTQVDTWKRGTVEEVVRHAVADAEELDLPLVAVLEDWGAGGPRGLAQWIGLGEARGVWRRWLTIAARESEALTLSRIVKAPQSRWRGRVIPETGAREGDGRWRPFTPDEWKAAARRAAMDYFLDTEIPIQEDAAESACMLVYAARSDEVLKALGKRHLKKWGISPQHMEPLEKTIRGSKRPRRSG